MDNKYAKEIAKELRLIRIELQKITPSPEQKSVNVDGAEIAEASKEPSAGDKVTIK